MERNVYISIRGLHQLQSGDGSDEEVELVSPGHYYKRNGKQYISYEEQLGPDMDGVSATVKVDENSVSVSHRGGLGSHMCFEPGKRNLTIYQTPFGVMEMGVTTQTLEMDLQEHNWKIDVSYILDFDSHYSGEHEVHILVQDTKGEQRIHLA